MGIIYVLRNEGGGFLLGFTGSIGHSKILQAELIAILQGLRACWGNGYRQVQVFFDSTLAIAMLKGSVPQFHVYAALIFSIKSMLHRSWQVELQHSLREGNAPTDFMAKLGADLPSVQLQHFTEPPSGLAPLLLADSLGVPQLRP
ncbi:uncharacterized protein LOC130719836 [Lotus japonicus]|uniref:uncharacterized protein LOC130719836 n=1 Tax=Lotus japonicus TaxID=34305 RepID=UPI00258D3C9D|nr:uncharacterized protein LOC130719836 [Lotus japonicus]